MLRFGTKAITGTTTDQDNNTLNAWAYNFDWVIATEGTIEHLSHFIGLSIYLLDGMTEEAVNEALLTDALAQLDARKAGIMYETVNTAE